MDSQEIREKLKVGELTADQALAEMRKSPWIELGDIQSDIDRNPIECGFPSFDNALFFPRGEGEVIVLAARPGHGKTALACQMALAISRKHRVAFFSMEMASTQIHKRFIALESETPLNKLKDPQYRSKYEKAKLSLKNYNFTINDEKYDASGLIAQAYAAYQDKPYDFLLFDYLGMLQVDNIVKASALSDAIKRIKKDVAQRFKIPVLILVQATRMFESRWITDNKTRPVMSDLAESSGIEHTADCILFMHMPSKAKVDLPPGVDIYCIKNRHGEMDDFHFDFSGALYKFFDNGGGVF